MSQRWMALAMLCSSWACKRETKPVLIPSNFPLHAPEPAPTTTSTTVYTAPEPTGWSPIQGFEGEIAYESLDLGTEACIARIGLRGTAYEGNCPACEFAFDIDSDVLESSGTGCEDMVPIWSMVEGDVYKNPKLGFIDQYLFFDNVLWFGYSLDLSSYGYGYYEGPFWTIIHHDGFPDASLLFDGESLSWEAESMVEYGYGLSDYLDYTCPLLITYPSGPYTDGMIAYGASDCDAFTLDVYEFTAIEGDTLELSVDTTSDDTSFLPILLLVDPGGCVKIFSVNSFPCDHPGPLSGNCPGFRLDAPETGTYQAIVQVYDGTCVGSDVGEYSLVVRGASGGELVLIADDTPRYDELRTYETRVSLEGDLLFFE